MMWIVLSCDQSKMSSSLQQRMEDLKRRLNIENRSVDNDRDRRISRPNDPGMPTINSEQSNVSPRRPRQSKKHDEMSQFCQQEQKQNTILNNVYMFYKLKQC